MKYLWRKELVKNPEKFEISLRKYQKVNRSKKQRFGFGKQKSQQHQLRIQRIKRTHHYYRLISRKRAIINEIKKMKNKQEDNNERIQKMEDEEEQMDQQIGRELQMIEKISSEIEKQKMQDEAISFSITQKMSQKDFPEQVSDNKFIQSMHYEQSTHKIPESIKKIKIKVRKDPIEVSPETIQKMQGEGSIHICSAHFSRRISSRILKKHLMAKESLPDMLQEISTLYPQFPSVSSKEFFEQFEKQIKF